MIGENVLQSADHRVIPSRRGDVEALRGLAVACVVLYHVGIPGFAGGYVGVDAFFVISGFLITGLILDERERSGRVSLTAFYARRMRRILPLAFVSLVIITIASLVVLPSVLLDGLAQDVQAVATFSMNFHLIDVGTDYLQAGTAPSPLQHYWSLAVEEQFYLLWPLALTAMLALTRRRSLIGIASIVAAAVSLFLSQRMLQHVPLEAYFRLSSRMWQPLAGAIVALLHHRLTRLGVVARNIVGAASFSMLIIAVAAYDDNTPFPGFSALVPTLGACGVIVSTGQPLGWVARNPLLQWIGARSYGWYLFHWPAIVLATTWADAGDQLTYAIAAALGALVLADTTHRLLERPLATGVGWTRQSRPLLIGGVGLIALSVVFAFAVTPRLVPGAEPSAESQRPTASATPPATTQNLDLAALTRTVPAALTPSLEGAATALPSVYGNGCHLSAEATVTPPTCQIGNSPRKVMLFGDSHAAQWFPLLESLAADGGWTLLNRTKSGCAIVNATILREQTGGGPYVECDAWRDRTIDEIRLDPPDLVLVSMADVYHLEDGQDSTSTAWRDAFVDTISTLASATQVVLIGDTPLPTANVPECLSLHMNDATACVRSRVDALASGTELREREVARMSGARFLPTVDLLCGAASCPVIVESLLVYRDASHITPAMAEWLRAPFVGALDALGLGWLGADTTASTTTTPG